MRINRSLITNFQQELDWGFVTGRPTTLSGYGITDAVPSSRTLTINGTSYDLTANRSWTVTAAGVSGTTNYIPKFATSTTLGDSLIYDSGTNIGIGTTSPAEKLDVRGKTYINNGGELYIDPSSSSTIFATTGARPLDFEVNGAIRQRITSAGNVLIGTTTDSGEKLQVSGNVKSTGYFNANDGTRNFYLNPGADYGNGALPTVQVASNHALQFATNNTLRLTIASTGAATFSSTIQTAAPSGYNAKPYKFGEVFDGTLTPTDYIVVEIDGNIYSIPCIPGTP